MGESPVSVCHTTARLAPAESVNSMELKVLERLGALLFLAASQEPLGGDSCLVFIRSYALYLGVPGCRYNRLFISKMLIFSDY